MLSHKAVLFNIQFKVCRMGRKRGNYSIWEVNWIYYSQAHLISPEVGYLPKHTGMVSVNR